MTLRTKSRVRQWTVWLCLLLLLLAVYVIGSRLLFDSVRWNPFTPQCHRLALPLLALFVYLAKETRWDGIRREKEEVKEKVKIEGEAEKVERRGEQRRAASDLTRRAAASAEEGDHHCPPPPPPSPPPSPHLSAPPTQPAGVSAAEGEELFVQARDLPHQVIPDFEFDGPYLDILGKSATAGYAPALAKLGEYAMRRAAWVEAYYWMKQAQRNGMHGLSPTLREIRKNWSQDGFPGQLSNVNKLFTVEFGSLGRALLHVDSGHEAAKAREFLKKHYPAYL